MIFEIRGRLNSSNLISRIYWIGSALAYITSTSYFVTDTKLHVSISIKCLMFIRLLICLTLSTISLLWGDDYGVYQYIPDVLIPGSTKTSPEEFLDRGHQNTSGVYSYFDIGQKTTSQENDKFKDFLSQMNNKQVNTIKPVSSFNGSNNGQGFIIKIGENVVTINGQFLFRVYVRNGKNQEISSFKETYDKFRILENEIRKKLLTSQQLDLPPILDAAPSYSVDFYASNISRGSYNNPSSSVQTQLKMLKDFVYAISQNQQCYILPFFEFFKIPSELSAPYLEEFDRSRNAKSNSIGSSSSNIFAHHTDSNKRVSTYSKCSTNNNIIDEQHLDWKYFLKSETLKYCNYYDVSYIDFYKTSGKNPYIIYAFVVKEIGYINLQQWEITKRFSDFDDLHEVLKKCNSDYSYPPLPSHFHLPSYDKNKRGKDLEEWLLLVLNQKVFVHQQIYEFIGMNQVDLNKTYVKSHEHWASDFRFKINVTGYVKVTADIQNDPFVAFRVSVKIIHNETNTEVGSHEVLRRFKDFCEIHKILKDRFKKTQIFIPNFPTKFGIRSNIHIFRVQELDCFLKELSAYAYVFDCIAVLKFFGLKPREIENGQSMSYRVLTRKNS